MKPYQSRSSRIIATKWSESTIVLSEVPWMTESLVKLRILLGPKIPQDFWSAVQIVLESQRLRLIREVTDFWHKNKALRLESFVDWRHNFSLERSLFDLQKRHLTPVCSNNVDEGSDCEYSIAIWKTRKTCRNLNYLTFKFFKYRQYSNSKNSNIETRPFKV